MAFNMLRAFQSAGHEQFAVTSTWTDGQFSRRLRGLNIREVALPFGTLSKTLALRPIWWTANTLAKLPSLWTGWSKVLRDFNPQIIVLTNARQALLLYPWLKVCPCFLIEQSGKSENWSNKQVYKRLSGKLASFVPASDFMIAHLRRLGVPPEKICVIKNGALSSSDRFIIPESFNCEQKPSRIRIGIAGQISPHKGHGTLLSAAKTLREKGVDFIVRVFGRGPPEYSDHLKHEILVSGLSDYWEWMGYESEPSKMYGAMDICAMPSCFDEPFGMVALEAAGYGLPVVASRRGGLPEIVEHGVTGFTFDSNRPQEMAARILWLIQHPQQARKMGADARKRAFRLFTLEKMGSEFETLFREHRAAEFRPCHEPQKRGSE